MSRCPECKSEMLPVTETETQIFGEHSMVFNIPALACQCGEIVFRGKDLLANELEIAAWVIREQIDHPDAKEFLKLVSKYACDELTVEAERLGMYEKN